MNRAGRKPYGFYADERAVIEVIKLKSRKRKGADKPLGPWQIAAELNHDGFAGPAGGRWNGLSVKRILARLKDGPATPKRRKRPPKTHLDATDYLNRREVQACRAVLRDSDRLLFETLLGAGLRAGELCGLRIGDLYLNRGRREIMVRRTVGKNITKTGRRRCVTIGPKLKRLLRNWSRQRMEHPLGCAAPLPAVGRMPVFVNRKGLAMNYQNLYDCICRIRDRSGVAHLHPHALRHTFASVLYHYQKDLETVRKQLGHASIATTQIYINVFSDSELEQMTGFERYFDLNKNTQTLEVK